MSLVRLRVLLSRLHLGPRPLAAQGVDPARLGRPLYDCGRLAWWARWTYALVVADLVVTYVVVAFLSRGLEVVGWWGYVRLERGDAVGCWGRGPEVRWTWPAVPHTDVTRVAQCANALEGTRPRGRRPRVYMPSCLSYVSSLPASDVRSTSHVRGRGDASLEYASAGSDPSCNTAPWFPASLYAHYSAPCAGLTPHPPPRSRMSRPVDRRAPTKKSAYIRARNAHQQARVADQASAPASGRDVRRWVDSHRGGFNFTQIEERERNGHKTAQPRSSASRFAACGWVAGWLDGFELPRAHMRVYCYLCSIRRTDPSRERSNTRHGRAFSLPTPRVAPRSSCCSLTCGSDGGRAGSKPPRAVHMRSTFPVLDPSDRLADRAVQCARSGTRSRFLR